MIGEIIAIGDELTSGRIVNTTSGLAARELFLLGHEIRAMHTIGDVPALIGDTLRAVVARCDFVIVTGGLGATSDDMTNEAVIEALGLIGTVHPGVEANIASRRDKDGDAAAFLVKLAWLPEGAEVLDPECRMAGYLLRHRGKPIWFLPGVPPQMEILLRTKVLPGLRDFDRNRARPVRQTVYRTCGLFEIEINQRLRPLEEQGLAIGYYPVGCEVHVSLTTGPAPDGDADSSPQAADAFIRKVLGDNLYGMGGETLASAAGCLLEQRGWMLGTAESCTGGLIGSTLTATPGSSRWFKGGVIAYGNAVKERLLGVDPDLLARHGAVSGETARAMADGALRRLDCDIAVAATGIAGPDGGTPDKPVGTVYLGLATRDTVIDRLCRFTGSRRQIQEKTAQAAVDMVRRALLAR
ncbi:nicotinamide-nucleotide amidohydrolase family protein [Desulfobulbus sp.]|uniref:nicotinamide-nucleotide amidohydrolase family protein n=1 Tax=Desulfobulbus sp. TaxID=895 RepID=UPI00286ED7AB|nr:nicotinamide-nucleotide amidohydrolase family protein [Desulfobulbus sp.]